jgi:hypothetical protein
MNFNEDTLSNITKLAPELRDIIYQNIDLESIIEKRLPIKIPKYYREKQHGIVEYLALNSKYLFYPKNTRIFFNNTTSHTQTKAIEITKEFNLEHNECYTLLLRNNKVSVLDDYFDMVKVGFKHISGEPNWNMNFISKGYFIDSQMTQNEGEEYADMSNMDFEDKIVLKCDLSDKPYILFLFDTFSISKIKKQKIFNSPDILDTKIHPRLKLIMFQNLVVGLIYMNYIHFKSYTPLATYDPDESNHNFDFLSYYCSKKYFEKFDSKNKIANNLAEGFLFSGSSEDPYNGFFDYILFSKDLSDDLNMKYALQTLKYNFTDGDYVTKDDMGRIVVNLEKLGKKFNFQHKNKRLLIN